MDTYPFFRSQIAREKQKDKRTSTKAMKKILLICSAFGLLTAMMPAVWAQEKDEDAKKGEDSEKNEASKKTDAPGVVVAETNIVKGTVENIDLAKRKVTLKDAEGDLHTMKVSDEVRNLDQMKKGDEVVAGYYRSTAISVGKPGDTSTPPAAGQAVIRSEKGDKPGGMVVQTVQSTATVEDID